MLPHGDTEVEASWMGHYRGGQSRAGCVDASGAFRMTHNGVGLCWSVCREDRTSCLWSKGV